MNNLQNLSHHSDHEPNTKNQNVLCVNNDTKDNQNDNSDNDSIKIDINSSNNKYINQIHTSDNCDSDNLNNLINNYSNNFPDTKSPQDISGNSHTNSDIHRDLKILKHEPSIKNIQISMLKKHSKELITKTIDFEKYFGTDKAFNVFLIKLIFYQKIRSENNFTVFERNTKKLLNDIQKVTHFSENDSKNMHHLFIIHKYQKSSLPTLTGIKMQYLADQIKYYMTNNHISIAQLHGFSMTDSKSRLIPTVLTERPVKGPLSSLFERESINSEQKFCMICGILSAIQFINKGKLIHSNLNPSTIYVDEKFRVKVCDYIFIPSFYRINKINSIFSFSKKPNPSEFYKNGLYIAPEIIKGDDSFNEMVDIYSIGLIIFFILFEKDPTFSNGFIEFPSEINQYWKDLITRCTNKKVSLRPSVNSILSNLLDNKNTLNLISSIKMETQTSISSRTKLYLLSLINKEQFINIFENYVLDLSIIDEETLILIQLAAKDDVESLEKVGTYFLNGEKNLYKDEELAYECFQQAANHQSVKAILKVAEMNENGVGCKQSKENAEKYYKMAFNKIDVTNPERSLIESKIKEIEERKKSILIKTVSDKITPENIKSLLKLKNPYEVIPNESYENVFELKFTDRIEMVITSRDIERGKYHKAFNIFKPKNIDAFKIYNSPVPLFPKIDIDDYYPGKNNKSCIRLKQDEFTSIYLVYNKKTQIPYAAKIYEVNRSKAAIKMFRQEIIIASKINHPSFIEYIGYSEYNISQYISYPTIKNQGYYMPTLLMKFITNGSLGRMIKSHEKNWTSTAKLKAIIGIASGIAELNSLNIVHRNLTDKNILLDENYEPLITDLSYSKIISKIKMTQSVGTYAYMAPELVLYSSLLYKWEVDSYSFGIILYQILTGIPITDIYPVDSLMKLMDLKINNIIPKIPDNVHPIFVDIITSCWNASCDNRLDGATIYTILVDAVRKREKLLDDVDYEAVEEYIKRLDNKERLSPKDEKEKIKHYETIIRKEYELDENEIKRIKSLKINEIDLQEFNKIHSLGSGRFSKVFLIKNIKTNKKYAIKQYFQSEEDKKNFIRELEIHSEANHPLIPKIIGYSLVDFNQESSMIIVMEFIKNGTLERLLNEERHKITIDEWNETTKLINIYGIASTISYLHRNNILHLDIKPYNVLIDDFVFPRICDFSISVKTNDDQQNKLGFGGTIPFMAPEVCDRESRTFKSDVYSFGILLYIMKYKKVPFEDCEMLEYWNKVVKNKNRPKLDDSVPKVYRNLIESCWDCDPNKRPTFDFIIDELENNKEFITNGVVESLYKNFIDIVKSDFKNENLMKNFPPIDLNPLYKSKKEEIYIDPKISSTLLAYLEDSLMDDFENMEEVTMIENDIETTVSEYRNKKTGRKFTVTISNIPVESITKTKEEADKIFKLNHPTIERLFGFSLKDPKNQQNPTMISEYYPFKTLKEIIKKESQGNHNIEWTNTKKLINIYGIAFGMKYLHKHGILHPTLNPKNIHIDSNYQPKLSGILEFKNLQTFSKFTSVGIDENYFYYSLEYLRGRNYCTEKSDVYSFAVVVYEILTNENPYKQSIIKESTDSTFEFVSKKEQGKYKLVFDKNIPVAYQKLIKICMALNQDERPSFDSVVEKLGNDSSFILDDVDEDEFSKYKQFIQNYK